MRQARYYIHSNHHASFQTKIKGTNAHSNVKKSLKTVDQFMFNGRYRAKHHV
jgi:hypothetical protein